MSREIKIYKMKMSENGQQERFCGACYRFAIDCVMQSNYTSKISLAVGMKTETCKIK